MKKISSLLIAVVLILGTFIPLNAYAASCSLSASASKSSVNVGDTFTVSVSINAQDISGFSAKVTFDDTLANRVSTSHSTLYNNFDVKAQSDVGCSAAGDTTDLNGVLFTMTFKAQKAGTLKINLEGTADSSGVITPSVSGTSVTISNTTTTEKPTTTTTKPSTSSTTKTTTTAKTTTTKKATTTTTKKETTTIKLTKIKTKKATVNKGTAFQLEADSKLTGTITYASANTAVAIVSTTGKVSTLKPGTVYITATSSNHYEQKWLVVVTDPESTTVDMTTAVDGTTQFEEISVSEVETNKNDVFGTTTIDNNSNNDGNSRMRKIIIIIGSAAVICVAVITGINFYIDKKKRLNALDGENVSDETNHNE